MPDEARACSHSGSNGGGVHSSGDPYHVYEKLGLPPAKYKFWCWSCWKEFGKDEIKLIRDDIKKRLQDLNICGYDEAYVGPCFEQRPCRLHDREKCWYCGAQAVRTCAEAGSLVCGVPECEDHPHRH